MDVAMEAAAVAGATRAVPVAPPLVARAVSEASSCRTDGEASSTDTSPAATPLRPCMASGEEEEHAGGGSRTDLVSLFKEAYGLFFPEEEDAAARDEEASPRRQQQQQRRRPKHTAPPVLEATTQAKRPRRLSSRLGVEQLQQGHEQGQAGGGDVGLAALPGECLREVVGFLSASDIWPSFALVSKRVSYRSAVVPLLLEACPRRCVPGAVLGLWAAAAATATGEQEEEAAHQQLLAPCRNLRALDLSHLPLGEAGGRRLARALGERDGLPALRSLNLERSGLNGPVFEALTRALLPHPPIRTTACALESLVLAGNGIGDGGLTDLGRSLREGGCPRLQVLNRFFSRRVEIGENTRQYAHHALHIHTPFTGSGPRRHGHYGARRRASRASLRVWPLLPAPPPRRVPQPGAGRGGRGTAPVWYAGRRRAHARGTSSLRSHCDCGVLVLLRNRANLSTLPRASVQQELRLRGCGLGPTGVEAVAAAFAAGTLGRLRLLDLENNGVGAAGLAALLHSWSIAASSSSTTPLRLQHLHLGRNELGDRGVQLLGQALGLLSGSSSSLETLSLPSNALTADGDSANWAGLEGTGSLRTLDLSHNPMGPEGVRGLTRCLQQGAWPRLTDLDLSGTGLGDEGLSHVAAALTTTPVPGLRRLLLRDCGVGDAGLMRLAGALGRLACPALEELGLGGNGGIGDKGASALAKAIERRGLERLRVLDLRGSGVRSEGLGALVLSCRARAHALETLDFSNPGVDGGVQALGAYWLSASLGEGAFPRLQTLRLGGQGVGHAGVYALHVAARNGALRCLRTLDLGDNPEMGDTGVGYLAIALRRGCLPQLHALNLSNCAVGDKGLRHLAHALVAGASRQQTRLVRLALARNSGVTAEGMAYLSRDVLPELQHLDLDGCRRLGNKGFSILLASGALHELQTLRLGKTGVGDEGLKALSALLAGNGCRSLESLVVTGNPSIGSRGAIALARALGMKRCPLLRELELGAPGVGEAGKQALATALFVDAAAPLCRLAFV